MHKIMTVIIMITTVLVIMFVAVKSVLSAPYFIEPTPGVLMVREMKPGCRSAYPTPACIGAMKTLNGRTIYYYDQNGKLKLKLKSIWEYKKRR